MSVPLLCFVFDRRKKAKNRTQEGSVELRVTYGKEVRYIQTGVRLHPGEWSFGTVCRRADAQEVQETLNILMKRTRDTMNTLMRDGNFSLKELVARVDMKQDAYSTFIEYIYERTEFRTFGKSEGTAKRYQVFYNFMMSYGKIIQFCDVTEKSVLELEKYLVRKGLKQSTRWTGYHRFLNSFIVDAVADGLISRNPYKWIHISKGDDDGIERYLTKDEVERIKNAEFKYPHQERVRDLFLFQMYTCLSYSDLAAFDAKKCIQLENNIKIYRGKRIKTGHDFIFVVAPEAEKILDKYKYHLPIISDVKYNKYLKEVAMVCDIDKPLSSHWARHTGATLLLNAGLDMEVISKILGHSSTRETRKTYAKLLDETIIQQMIDIKI